MGILATAFAKHFNAASRSRGQELFRNKLVEVVTGGTWEVQANVQGTDNYEVELRRDGNRIQVCCTCPYYEGTGPCKHLWATILEADADELLRGDGRVNGLVMVEEPSDPEGEFDSDLLEDDLTGDIFDLTPPAPRRPVSFRQPTSPPAPPPVPNWQKKLAEVEARARYSRPVEWPLSRRLVYLVDASVVRVSETVPVEVAFQDRKLSGDWSKPKSQRIPSELLEHLPDPEDRAILATMAGGRSAHSYAWSEIEPRQLLRSPLAEMLIARICATGRCGLRTGKDDWKPLSWDENGRWQPVFQLSLEFGRWSFGAYLGRQGQRLPLVDIVLLTPGVVFTAAQAAPFDDQGAFAWLSFLCSGGRLEAPAQDGPEFLSRLLNSSHLPPLEVPPELEYKIERVPPQPKVHVSQVRIYTGNPKLLGELSFCYADVEIPYHDPRPGAYDPARRLLMRRDSTAEGAAVERLERYRLKPFASHWVNGRQGWEVPLNRLPHLVSELTAENWQVHAEGKLFRKPSSLRLDLGSGIDWFELRGEADFGSARATLPELLKALRRGDKTVLLDDGTFGILPEEWLSRLEAFAGFGDPQADHVRFGANQAGLLDVLLAEQPEVRVDEVFERARRQLREFEGVRAVEQPAGLEGRLRVYQCEGLGWMQFLERFGFGGCLADDMGVGKTVQVLALLEIRRAAGGNGAAAQGGSSAKLASLAVVPRSLIFNWIEEAGRFTPKLRLKDYTGAVRTAADFADYDLILTTYGTLQRDAAALKDIEFDYVILDEAQAIKNAETKSAKAARLLRARHRLALSGTPVENHLGELWSLFEFLNPGMLGSSWLGKKASQALRNPDEATRRTLARVLRPFILRRTKEQVASELPPKLEQTLLCEMQGAQRRLYDELRDHYRRTLLGKVEEQGLARSKMHVLEALLRLRQAACHPGLIDPKRAAEPSAKLDTLLPRLAEVLDEGHKALVFSQFTSLLAIVRQRLDADKIVYEYLDGKTTDRQACVERFQNDPGCRLFLISLKAGGLGLNLTAAEYVFLLDPWWNPAVEAQAIDRAHRIGQSRPVFAYRLIAKDTVEEKILELQRSKRDLADAIITADNSVLGTLTREDLELLLS